jgi:peptidoglycan/xylan/chitin deacetylase (PgdA/CDA1 family)
MHAETPVAHPPRAAAARWRPPLLVQASVACHLGAGVAVAALPTTWPWAAAAVGLNHLLLTATGLWPRSTWLGPNMNRLHGPAVERGEVAITIDDGPDPEVTPAVLDLLDAHAVRATFFCIAERARAHPQLCRQIVARGHSVQNHSRDHSHRFSLLGPGGFAREIGAAQRMLADVTGHLPRYFRAPAGVRNPLLGPVLQRLDLELVSWTRRGYDTVQRRPARVLARLSHALAAGDILLLHDGNAARAADGRPVLLAVLPALLHELALHGLRAVTLPQAARVEAVPE